MYSPTRLLHGDINNDNDDDNDKGNYNYRRRIHESYMTHASLIHDLSILYAFLIHDNDNKLSFQLLNVFRGSDKSKREKNWIKISYSLTPTVLLVFEAEQPCIQLNTHIQSYIHTYMFGIFYHCRWFIFITEHPTMMQFILKIKHFICFAYLFPTPHSISLPSKISDLIHSIFYWNKFYFYSRKLQILLLLRTSFEGFTNLIWYVN